MKLIKILLPIILIILFSAIATLSQESPTKSIASDSATTQPAPSGEKLTSVATTDQSDCDELLRIANQRLLKTLDTLDKSEKLNAANEVASAKKDSLIALDEQIISKKDEVIANQDSLIKAYEKRKGTTVSFFWGLVKFKKN